MGGGEKVDVIIIGAGYSGIIIGAILAKNGVKPLIIEKQDYIGGRGGALYYEGYWIDIGPHEIPFYYGEQAADAVGAVVTKKGPIYPLMRGHLLPERKTVPIELEPEEFPNTAREYLGVPGDQVPKFLDLIKALAGERPEKIQALKGVSLDKWLAANVKEPEIRAAFHTIAMTLAIPGDWPPMTSVGEIAKLLQWGHTRLRLHYFNDDEVGGMQGIIEPFARVIREKGSEIRTGVEVTEIIMEDYTAKGVVIKDRLDFLEEIRAPIIVNTLPIWEIFRIISEEYFPQLFVNRARELSRWTCDCVGYWIGLGRLPTKRSDGKPETYNGWNRVAIGEGRVYGGGWHIVSMNSEKVAPEGKHLLNVARGYPGRIKSLKEAEQYLSETFNFVKEFYTDLDEITEWTKLQINRGATWPNWVWSTVPRAPLKAPGIKGLYFAGDTTEVNGCFQDMCACSGMEVANLILREFGKPEIDIRH